MGEIVNAYQCTIDRVGLGIMDKKYCLVVGLLNHNQEKMTVTLTEGEADYLQDGLNRYIKKLKSINEWPGPECN